MIYHEIVGPRRRAKYDRWKIGVLAIAFRPTDELNDLCAHDKPSHTAIATRPANASEIRYAVMAGLACSESNMRHDLLRSFQARTLSLQERPRADADPVHAARRCVRAHRQCR